MDMPVTRNALVASSVDSPPKAMTGSIVKLTVEGWMTGQPGRCPASEPSRSRMWRRLSCCSGGIAERIKRITSSVNSGYCDADFAVLCPNCHRMLQGQAALTLNELRDRMASIEQTR
jgi:hypothetical protein